LNRERKSSLARASRSEGRDELLNLMTRLFDNENDEVDLNTLTNFIQKESVESQSPVGVQVSQQTVSQPNPTTATWQCSSCTFINTNSSNTNCEICGASRSEQVSSNRTLATSILNNENGQHDSAQVQASHDQTVTQTDTTTWQCSSCTFINTNSSSTNCEICGGVRAS